MSHAKPSQASQAIQDQIILILSDDRELRQFEITAELQVPEHNNWTTHAALESMLKAELISFEWYHNILKDGTLSKIPYRFFSLTHKGEDELYRIVPNQSTKNLQTLWLGCIPRIRAILGI